MGDMSGPNRGKRVTLVVALGLALSILGALVYTSSVFHNVQTLPLWRGRPPVHRGYGLTGRTAVLLWLGLAAVWVEASVLFLRTPRLSGGSSAG